MARSTVKETLEHVGIQPDFPEEIKQLLIHNSYRTGNEECETAWTHIARCEECSAMLYPVAITPELAGHVSWWTSSELAKDPDI